MISAINGATLSASLRTGTTMETATASLSEESKIGARVLGRFCWVNFLGWICPKPEPVLSGCWRRPLLWGGSAPGNPFEASGRGSNKGHNGAVVADRKPEPAGRKPIAHEHRTDDPDQRTGHHVTGVVGYQHQTGRRDDEGIDGHRNASLRPDGRHRESERKCGGGMAGRETVVGRVSGEVRKVEGVGLAADKRPATANDPFQDFRDEHGHGYRQEQELQPRSQPEQQRALDAAQGR